MVSDEDDHQSSGICNPQEIGGHFLKIPFIGFQIMLFMRLEVSWVLAIPCDDCFQIFPS
jgi:hypothetical protein